MNKLITLTALALSVGLAGCASAGPRWQHHDRSYEDTARVLKVQPIYETVTVTIPEERCWNEPARHHRGHRRDSYTAPILGAIVGGVVGNQFGGGSGKTALTVAGSLLGASIANDVSHQQRHAPHHARRHCEVVERYETREEIVAYRVKYRYKGRVYHTRMDYDPGDTLRVSVDVRPIH